MHKKIHSLKYLDEHKTQMQNVTWDRIYYYNIASLWCYWTTISQPYDRSYTRKVNNIFSLNPCVRVRGGKYLLTYPSGFLYHYKQSDEGIYKFTAIM